MWPAKLDALDRRILREVQRNCMISGADLASSCATTETTALRRLQRLRRAGVIQREVAIVDGAKVGKDLLLFVTLRLEREDGPAVREFVGRIKNHPDVQQFYFVTGTLDYIIVLCVGSMEQYDEFLQEQLVPDPLVVLSETSVVIRTLKADTAIRID